MLKFTETKGIYIIYTVDLGLNEVDGDFYSGVNVTDDAASKI